MCEYWAGKMYCRCCGEAFHFNGKESHRSDCPHVRNTEIEVLKQRVAKLEAEATTTKENHDRD